MRLLGPRAECEALDAVLADRSSVGRRPGSFRPVSTGRNTLGFFDVKGATVPAAVSVFPRELYQAPQRWTEKAYPNLIYFNEVDEGNHFAAWQEPDLFTTEVRAAFKSLR